MLTSVKFFFIQKHPKKQVSPEALEKFTSWPRITQIVCLSSFHLMSWFIEEYFCKSPPFFKRYTRNIFVIFSHTTFWTFFYFLFFVFGVVHQTQIKFKFNDGRKKYFTPCLFNLTHRRRFRVSISISRCKLFESVFYCRFFKLIPILTYSIRSIITIKRLMTSGTN